MVRAGDVRFMLGQDDWKKGRDRKKGEGFRLYCETKQSVDAIAEKIKARGGTLDQEPHDEPWGVRGLRPDRSRRVQDHDRGGGEEALGTSSAGPEGGARPVSASPPRSACRARPGSPGSAPACRGSRSGAPRRSRRPGIDTSAPRSPPPNPKPELHACRRVIRRARFRPLGPSSISAFPASSQAT